MVNPIGMYFQYAQFAMAAYADLSAAMASENYINALKGEGFTNSLAGQFVATYKIAADTFTDPGTGLSVTLFQHIATGEKILAIRGTNPEEISDLITDGLLVAGESATLNPQYVALQAYYAQLVERGTLQPNELFSVTGHSLGGFLAQAFTVDHATNIRHTYTYNAPGIGGAVIEVLERLGVAEHTVPSGLITNIVSKNGLSIAAGLGTQIGTPVDIFIEETGLNTSFHDHQIATATDALAWYDLAATIDPTINVATGTRLLEASSSIATRRLETSLDTLRALFTGDRMPTPVGPSGIGDPNREAYYSNLLGLRASLSGSSIYRFVDLVGMSSSAIFGEARSLSPDGLAYRYALRELNPFVMIGIDYETLHNQDHSLDIYDASTGTGGWTHVALSDRAELLAEKLRFNLNDGTPSSPTLFVDETTNFNNQRGAAAAEAVIFGDGEGREYLGRRGNDHIYGGAGDDFVHGAAGQDYLEGNDGKDELYGEADNDILVGQQGNDKLDGGTGVDHMSGGAGDDIYIVDNSGDSVVEIDNGGVDEVLASASFSLGVYVENLTLTGMGNISGTGNNLDNRITGNSGNNQLTGMGGNDLLKGGIGFDTYVYTSGDGVDRIEDSDAQGQILFDGRVLQGGIRRAGDAGNAYTSLDGRTTYVMSGTDLIVNGVLIVNENFQSGQMGIQLRDMSGMPRDTGVPTGPFTGTYMGDADAEEWVPNAGAIEVYANGGNDVLHGDHAPILGAFDDLLDGGIGNDVFFGGYGNDYLIGGYGDDYAFVTDGDMFFGGDGDDYAVGTANYLTFTGPMIGSGAHYADGGAGNDTLMGEMGADVLLGGDGDDVLRGENRPTGWIGMAYDNYIWNRTAQAGVISLSGGDDYLDGGAGNDLLVGDGGNDILLGGAGDDRLYGESDFTQTIAGDDWLDGGDGNDSLFGGAGADMLSGGDGDDLLIGDFSGDPGAADILDGGAGADELQGGGGDDILYGGTGIDRLAGFGGNDVLDGGADNDELQGGSGDDSLWGGLGHDRMTGQEGDDTLFGDEGDDELEGDIGSDVLFGGEGDDALFGQDGDDVLSGEAGDDVLNGGLGNDQLDGGDGIDDVQGREGDDFLAGGAGNDFLYGDGNNPTVPNLVGGNDTLDGEGGDDQLWGGAGQDQVFGGDGADQLVGDFGDDQLYGEAGDDLLYGDSPFFPGQVGADVLDGGEGNDVLEGGGGDDDLDGGVGDDHLVGGSGLDTYRFNLGDGADTIQDDGVQSNRLVFGAGITAESLRLDVAPDDSLVLRVGAGGDSIQIMGFGLNASADFHTIRRFEFEDGTVVTDGELLARGFQLSASANGGSLHGTSFSDHIQGSPVGDWLYGRDGADVLLGGLGDDVLEGEEGDDELDGGAGNDRLYGGTGGNVLHGGEGNDLLDSVGLGDQLFGGAGDDEYHLRSMGQVVTEEVNAGRDTIYLSPTESLTFHAPDNVENVRIDDDVYIGPTMQVHLVGNTLDNELSGSHRLDGQAGHDILIGTGDNTFVFGPGYGQDVARMGLQVYDHSGLDQVEFLEGVAPSNLSLERQGHDLVVKITGTADELRVQSYYESPANMIDRFLFADGTVWTSGDIDAQVRIFIGVETDESLYGSTEDDIIRGMGGNDQIRASAGNDVLDGGTGNDFLEGGSGNDLYLFGRGYGQDSIDEQGDVEDVDTLQLLDGIAPGDITLRATADFGPDAILTINSTGDQVGLGGFFLSDAWRVDRIQFGDGTTWDYNVMRARTEGVNLIGSEETEYLYGNVTNDTLFGLGGDDTLSGGAGNDTLDGGTGADGMTGGTGNDLYVVDSSGDVVTEHTGQGTDTVQSSLTYTLGANLENLTLTGGLAINGTGNSLNNILIGNAGANVLTGGAGNDTYVVGVGDTVVEAASAGLDTVKSDISWTLGNNLEHLMLTGMAAVDATGNSLANTLTGNSATNILNGGAGADTLIGGQGDDLYLVDNVGDKVTELVGEGVDTVQSAVTYTLSANVEHLTLSGTAAINGTGNGLDNVLVGNSARNRLTGGAGSDTYVVGAGDTVVEAVNAGIDTVQSSVTWTLGSNVEHLVLTGSAAINGTGNALANMITGNGGNNFLTGGDGNDTISGGQGNDALSGGAGNDIFQFARGDGQDLVTDASGTGDRLNFSAGINPLDLMLSQSANDLRIGVYGSTDQVTIANWYGGAANQIETVQAGNGQQLLNTQINQLIQAMAGFTQQTGLSWDQAIAQRPQDVQQILAANWQ